MKPISIFSGLACLAALAGCAGPGATAVQPPVQSVQAALAEADVAIRAGQEEKAARILQSCATVHPTDKAPLVRLAQMYYDQGDYGQAIVSAHGVLARDPNDVLADSIAAVSGLRVASKALADLAHQHNLTGPVRSEAEGLARVLRTNLGEDVLVPGETSARNAQAPRRKAAIKTADTPADPFQSLK